MTHQADAIVIGSGLSGLVAASEITSAGKKVIVIDQESRENLGGQAFWSFGGLFMVDTPEQCRMGIKDSYDLALEDWLGTAGFDRPEDYWPRQWAQAYVAFAAGEKRSWLRQQGLKWFPVVGWAERGGYGAVGHGNSVPRFHVTWGTGPGVLEPFINKTLDAEKKGLLTFLFRHRVKELITSNGGIIGVRGNILEDQQKERGVPTSRSIKGDFECKAQALVIASGGIGGNLELVKKQWPQRLGKPPEFMVQGVPDYVDGSMLGIAESIGARVINKDRMWHYTEGLRNWNPIWTRHGIRILPGPSSLWLDARGKRLPPPLYPGFDTLGTLEYIGKSGFEHTWFILNQSIIKKEFALSGSEQNPDLTGKSWKMVLGRAFGKRATGPVEAFKEHGQDFVVKDNLADLVTGMNALTPTPLVDHAMVEREILARDRQLDNPYGKDLQLAAIRQARMYFGDKMIRTAKLCRILDPKHGPLIAVKLNILTRKTLGGLETNLAGQVFNHQGNTIPGLYAAGEASGFGGGGMHGYRSLEGSFLGGCIFSGRAAGRAMASQI